MSYYISMKYDADTLFNIITNSRFNITKDYFTLRDWSRVIIGRYDSYEDMLASRTIGELTKKAIRAAMFKNRLNEMLNE